MAAVSRSGAEVGYDNGQGGVGLLMVFESLCGLQANLSNIE